VTNIHYRLCNLFDQVLYNQCVAQIMNYFTSANVLQAKSISLHMYFIYRIFNACMPLIFVPDDDIVQVETCVRDVK
jgi:hypothetical protein